MKPASFAYHAPRDLLDAVACLASYGEDARVLAGGQSLIPMMNLRLVHPAALVDLRRVAALQGIDARVDAIQIGAMTSQHELGTSPEIARRFPLIEAAVAHVGHPAIRNRGTVGGNVANADPASELPAVFMALDATMHGRGPGGERSMPAGEFFLDAYTTALRPDEILTRIDVPDLPPRTGWGFEEFSRRHGDFAILAVAALVTLTADSAIGRARLVIVGVAPKPFRCQAAEDALVGRPADAVKAGEAGAIVAAAVSPESDLHASAEYRRHLAALLATRSLSSALSRARGGAGDDHRH